MPHDTSVTLTVPSPVVTVRSWKYFIFLQLNEAGRLITERRGFGGNMKKTGLLLILCCAIAMQAQEATPLTNHPSPAGTVATNANFPKEQFTTPTYADLYCAGFVRQHPLANVNYVASGLETPNTTHFATGELVYLAGKGYEAGQ